MNLWNRHILHYDIKDKKDLYIHTAFRIVGIKFVDIFLPVFLFHELGLSLSQIFLFFCVRSLGVALLVPLVVSKVVSTFGTKVGMFVGIPMLVAFLVSVPLIEHHSGLLYIVPLLGALYTAFFRIGFHTDMAQFATTKWFWLKLALLNIIITIMGAVIPTVSWFLLDSYAYTLSLYIGASVLVCSLVPLLHTWSYHKPLPYAPKKMIALSLQTSWIKALAAFAWQTYLRFLGAEIWPLIIFLLVGNYTKLWIVTTISVIVVVVVLYGTWKAADAHQEKNVMKITLGLQAGNLLTAWTVFVYAVASSIAIAVIDVFQRLTIQLNSTMIEKAMYEYAHKTQENPIYVTSLHEVGNHLSKAVICWLFAVFFLSVGNDPRYLFVTILIAVFLVPLQFLIFLNKPDTHSPVLLTK